jgi:hypothetical protein
MGLRMLSGIAALTVLATAAAAGEPFDWTGTYQGFVACDDVTAGAGGSFGVQMTLEIVQTGERIDARNTVEVVPSQGASHTLYRGRAMTSSAGDTVSGYIEACDATFPHKEMVRIFPASIDREPFGVAADTVFVSEAVPGEEGKLVAESCKWSLKRTSTERPSFDRCP